VRVEGNTPSSAKSSTVLSLTTEGAPRKPASEDIGCERKELDRSPPPHPLLSPDGSHGRELNPPPCPLPPVKSRHLEIQIKESSYDPEEFALYKKYQVWILGIPICLISRSRLN
jgi:hypothetical protein